MKYIKWCCVKNNTTISTNKNYKPYVPARIGYVYIGKDIEDARSLYKFGHTQNLAQRLKHYKTGQPNFEFLVKIKSNDYKNLETKLLQYYKPLLYQNEIFKGINLNHVKSQLKKWGYLPNADLIFEKKN